MKNLSKISRSAAVLLGSLAILSGCGGGGGGDGDSASTTPSGLRVTVSDTYGVAVAGATVEATVGTSVETGTTDAEGVALLIFSGATGTASVTVSRDTFVTFTEPAAATVAAELVTDLPIALVRATSPAGGSLTARTSLGAITPTLNGDGTLTFDIELVIVDGNSEPILGLTAADFVLKACTPDSGNDVPNFKVDCVRGTTPLAANFDAPYNSTTLHPLERVALAGAPAVPYAAALMLDQSGSIATSDPTGARLFSAKSFLDEIGPGEDWVLLSAFADGTALIPTPPARFICTVQGLDNGLFHAVVLRHPGFARKPRRWRHAALFCARQPGGTGG